MRKTSFYLILIAAAGLIAYSNTFQVPFQFDDFGNITENPVLQRLGNFLFSLKGYSYNPRRFIGYLTLALNYRFGGLEVAGYHAVNLAIHLTTAILVYFFVVLTFRTPYFSRGQSARGEGQGAAEKGQEAPWQQDNVNMPASSPIAYSPADDPPFKTHHSRAGELIALFSALLFVAHPLQTQAVTYIVQRFTSLAAMFYLLSVVTYIKGRLAAQRSAVSDPRLKSVFWYLSSLISAVLAMMTKEISFTLPLVIVLYEFMFFEASLKKKLAFLLPVLLTMVIIPIGVIGTHKPLGQIISDLSEKTRLQTDIPRWDYLLTEMRVVTTYLRLLFLPVNQNLDYDYPVYHSLLAPPVMSSFFFLASIFGAAVYLIYKSRGDGQETPPSPISRGPLPIASLYRLIAFGILWFFVTLSVESSFIPIVDVIFEHRMYLPSIGALIAFTAFVSIVIERVAGKTARPSAVVFAAFFAVVVIALSATTYARNRVWQGGLSLWEDVVRKSPGNARAYNNLGYIYLGRGRADRALEYFRAALQLNPSYADARDNVGIVYYEDGMFDAAIDQFRAVLTLQPGSADVHHNLGLAYVRKGLTDEALSEFSAALKLAPDNYEVYNDMGVVYREKGLSAKAIESFSNAVALKPDYAGAHYNLGLAYKAIGLNDKAKEHLERAHRLSPGQF